MQKHVLKKIKIAESGGVSVSLDYLTIGRGNPKTLILSGIHGTERTGNLVIAKLLENLPEFKGTLTVLPLANPLGYATNTRQEPLSGLDLNRQFTGKNDGRAIFAIAAAIMKLAEKHDHVVDLHNYPTAGVIQVGYSDLEKAKQLASLLKPDVIRLSHTEKEWKLDGTLMGILRKKEISSILVELPSHRCVTEEQVRKIVDGITGHLVNDDKNIQLKDNIDRIPQVRIKTIKSPLSGVFYSNNKHKLMGSVSKDDVLGEVVELPSQKRTEIKSPYDGIICEKEIQNKFPTVVGDTLFGIGA